MHELSIAEGLIDEIMRIAVENGLSRVDEVEIETGTLRQVVPEVMAEAFRAVSEGTPAERALLRIYEKKASAECKACGSAFEPQPNDITCTVCGATDTKITGGDEIILKAVVGDR
ncbi:MAG: hydrogenase maturation nickel metallochaperone HypA [Candidatus Omnitrophica bacterium]|nr:hydrogenase maturation nickel metallochaperone HypA [Candidatus Omnitrophota bacterium]MDD5487738.1 hydrogenase maturation nickel metallochaperone HypA [Candidatus Omnitrophota bacterium]